MSVAAPSDVFLLDLIVRHGLLPRSEAEQVRQRWQDVTKLSAEPLRLATWLVEAKLLSEAALARIVAEELGLPIIAPEAILPSAEALQLLPADVVRKSGLLPCTIRQGRVEVVTADPLDLETIDRVRELLGRPVDLIISTPSALATAIERYVMPESAPVPSPVVDSPPAAAAPARNSDVGGDEQADGRIVRLVNRVIEDAIRRGASDVHWEPLRDRFRVRFRVDGALMEAESPPKPWQLPTISRLKLMANISIAEKRVPQDGRVRLAVHGQAFDLRVSSLPTAHGESVVMRVLDQEGVKLGLEQLGFSADDQRDFAASLRAPDGIILVTGPTGSGKTTTLYSCLHHLNRSDRKIITVEDPVEYQLPGINQVPVRPEVGLTFAAALRAILRQAPNIVMVGEIRDTETAQVAIHAALTGHLVFSTLHTNDAPGAIARLLDLGLAPYQVAGAVRAVLAQRLVRRVCHACGGPASRCDPAAPALAQAIPATGDRDGDVPRQGCGRCRGTGYKGRFGVFELLQMDPRLQQVVQERAGAARLRAVARAAGMRSLREDALHKARAGQTTLAEALAATVDEQSS